MCASCFASSIHFLTYTICLIQLFPFDNHILIVLGDCINYEPHHVNFVLLLLPRGFEHSTQLPISSFLLFMFLPPSSTLMKRHIKLFNLIFYFNYFQGNVRYCLGVPGVVADEISQEVIVSVKLFHSALILVLIPGTASRTNTSGLGAHHSTLSQPSCAAEGV